VVNGPGEAKETAIGLTGGEPNLLYTDGKPSHKVKNEDLVDELEKQIRKRIEVQKLAQNENIIPIKDLS
jgi:(E)-4-hydroxy-3-methylbut-2-enyl-diphosphate synthase